MHQIPADTILSEHSVQAGVAALERIHGRHLADMSGEEQAEARSHWRDQVEQVLAAVHALHADPGASDRGRAVLIFIDGEEGEVDLDADFQPDLRQVGDQIEGTPAQVLALTALESLTGEEPG